jgi:glycosyltransferase involved in cell wall biosynthesis
MAMRRPLVSVCIAVYNCETYVGQAIESVLSQTLGDFELLVADNASTDKTIDVVQSYNDPRIRLIRNDRNIGMAPNFHRVMGAATGRFLKLLGADDVLYPTCLERQAEPLQKDPTLSMVCCRRDIIDHDGFQVLRNHGWRGRGGKYAGREAIRRIVRSGRNMPGEPLAVLFPTNLLRRVGELEPHNFDVDLWCHLLELGNLFVIRDSLAAFRISPSSSTINDNRTRPPSQRKFFERLSHRGAAPITRVDLVLGSARAMRDCYLRELVFTYIRILDLVRRWRSGAHLNRADGGSHRTG